MIIGAQPPGPWQYYVKRKDNIGLPVNEVRRKYLAEQLQFDNFQTQQLNMLQGRAGGGVNYPKELKEVYGQIDDEGELECTSVFPLTRGIKYNGVPIYYFEGGEEFILPVLHAWIGNRWGIGLGGVGEQITPTSPETVEQMLRGFTGDYLSTPTSRNNPRGTYKTITGGSPITIGTVLNPNDPLPCEIS